MKRVLFAGFTGESNSAKAILDRSSSELKKLYLENDFTVCAAQINAAVSADYEFIFIIGQKPAVKTLYIERYGRSSSGYYHTNFHYPLLMDALKKAGYKVRVSDNAGNYLCNHVYYHALQAVASEGRQTEVVFLHIPFLSHISNLEHLAITLSEFLLNL